MKRSRFESREDAETWRERLIGKRLVTSDPVVASHTGWTLPDKGRWEPRIYFNKPVQEGFEKDLKYDLQPQSSLLTLPAELRLHILEYVLPPQMISQDQEAREPEKGDATWMNTSAIIFCCKQLFAEGRSLASEKHTYQYEKLPKKVRLAATAGEEYWNYIWDLLNIICDTKTNIVKRVYYG